jgi:hypothetical protein
MYERKHSALVFLSLVYSSYIHLSSNHMYYSSWIRNTPLCIYISQVLGPFISFRASGLFPELGYREQCCDERRCTVLHLYLDLHFYG